MREDEFSQPAHEKSPIQIYQCLCIQPPTSRPFTRSKFKNFFALKEWLFPKNNENQPAEQYSSKSPKN